MPQQFSRPHGSSENSFSEVWSRLTPTLKGVLAGRRALLTTYAHLWYLCACRAGQIVVTAKEIASAMNVDERSARKDLDRLRDVGLVEFHDRDRETGQYALYVCAPEDPGRVSRAEPDPQVELFDDEPPATPPAEPKIVAGPFAQAGPQHNDAAGLSAQIGPRSEQRSLWDSGNDERAKKPAGLSAQIGTMDHETIEYEAIGTAALDENKSLTGSPTETKNARDAEAMDDLLRITDRRAPVPADDPAETHAAAKQRIVDRLIRWDAEFHPHTTTRMDSKRAGQIADHVLLDRVLAEKELYEWLEELRTAFLGGKKIGGRLIENVAGVLDGRLEKVLADNGISTRAKKKRRPK